ncbi:MAG: hypothetical protein JW866_03960 [Ignavibacteriales bacterium]|nr:hypothetical protein [Ignavibacteriales bacterium]
MKINQKIGKDAVVIGNVNADVGDGSVVINATDSNGNVILNRPMAIGRGAKADNTSIAIGANANAGYDINKALKDLSEIINNSKDEKLKLVFQDFLIEKGSGDHKKLGSLWHIIETSSTLSGCIAFVQQIGHALGLC